VLVASINPVIQRVQYDADALSFLQPLFFPRVAVFARARASTFCAGVARRKYFDTSVGPLRSAADPLHSACCTTSPQQIEV